LSNIERLSLTSWYARNRDGILLKIRISQHHSDAIRLATIAVVVFDAIVFVGSMIILVMWQLHGALGEDPSRFLLLGGLSAVINLAPAALLLVLGTKAETVRAGHFFACLW
jgi:hypothetical protein